MYKALNETKKLKRNKVQVNTTKNKLVNLLEAIKRSPTSDTKKKLKTEITCWKCLNLFFTLINKIKHEKD